LTPVAHEKIGKGAQQEKAHDQGADENPCSKNRFGLIFHLYLDPQVSDAEGIEKRPQDKADDQQDQDQGERGIPRRKIPGILMHHGPFPLFRVFSINTRTRQRKEKEDDEDQGRKQKKHDIPETDEFEETHKSSFTAFRFLPVPQRGAESGPVADPGTVRFSRPRKKSPG
jgi:hypothetical protein